MKLQGKRVVFIGGSSGIGLASAKVVAAEGASLVIVGRSEEKLKQVQEIINAEVEIYSVDVTQEDKVNTFFQEIGMFDHLVMTPFDSYMGSFLDLDSAAAHAVFACKFWGQYYAAKHGAPKLNNEGSITFFSGISSRKPFEKLSAIASVNGAIEALCRTLSIELAPIRVNVIAPGLVNTPAHNKIPENERQYFFDSVAAILPLNRIGIPEDIAQTVLYLIQNKFTTGTTIDVDGGHKLI